MWQLMPYMVHWGSWAIWGFGWSNTGRFARKKYLHECLSFWYVSLWNNAALKVLPKTKNHENLFTLYVPLHDYWESAARSQLSIQDSLDQCPMPIKANQNCHIDPNADQNRSLPINVNQIWSIPINAGSRIGIDRNWSALNRIDRKWSALRGISDKCQDFGRRWSVLGIYTYGVQTGCTYDMLIMIPSRASTLRFGVCIDGLFHPTSFQPKMLKYCLHTSII